MGMLSDAIGAMIVVGAIAFVISNPLVLLIVGIGTIVFLVNHWM